MEVSNTTVPTTAMEDDAVTRPETESDNGMEEGSDDDWANVASGSDNDDGGDDDGAGDDDDEQEEDADDDDDGDDDDDERDLIILCSMSLGRWERHEAAVEAAAEAEAAKQALSSTQSLAAKRQIFNPREAFSMLSRELLDFLRGRHVDCSVETEGDDIYHWIVDLGSFAEGSALAKDMREVSRRYVYSTVRLRLRFMRGLHPFFPPSVEVVWPHLAGPLLGAVASHPMLRLENWDPWRPAMETVAQIKAFLEAHARVDLDNPANDIRRHPTSTYSPLERGLARLEALSGVPPTCLQGTDVAELYNARDSYDKDAARLQALAEGGKKRGRSEPAAAKRTRDTVWARGTGYGSGQDKSGEMWDPKANVAAQAARDAEIQAILDEMSCSVVRELGPRAPLPQEAAEQQQQEKQNEQGEDTKQHEGAISKSDKAAGGGPEAMEGVETAEAAAEGVTGRAAAADDAVAGGDGGAAAAAEGEPLLGPERCCVALRDSCLVPFVTRELQMATFTDMGARHKYYSALLVLLRELCRPNTQEMLWMELDGRQGGEEAGGSGGSDTEGAAAAGTEGSAASAAATAGAGTSSSSTSSGQSVAAVLAAGLRSAAKMYLSVLGPANVQAEKGASATTSAAAGASTSAHVTSYKSAAEKAALAAENAAKEAEATQRMAQIIMQIADYVDANKPAPPPPPAAAAQQPKAAAASATATTLDGERAASGGQASTSGGPAAAGGGGGPGLYVSTLKPLQVDAVQGLARAHHYSTNQRGEQQVPRTRAVRLAKEVASLESLLPMSESSSVFVRVDETAVQLWKVIVVGPEDTPYSGGCFVFDMYFPPQYPAVPPQVHLCTTGGGRVRFNPNLYAEGKVCLSLLGTWSGDKVESWTADVSTAVQVLISIQSLIMVPEPYFNEPSFEGQTGERGKVASQDYNKLVRENCVRYAMLDVLRHPPACLADVVRTHFRLRRDPLLTQIKAWADEARPNDSAHANRLMELRRELEVLIGTL